MNSEFRVEIKRDSKYKTEFCLTSRFKRSHTLHWKPNNIEHALAELSDIFQAAYVNKILPSL